MKLINTLNLIWKENKIEVLTGLSIVGTVTTGVLSFRAGMKVRPVIDEYHFAMDKVRKGDKEAKKDVVKEAAKEIVPGVIPPIIAGGATIAATIGSTKTASKQIAILTAGCTIAEKAAKDLEDKLTEVVGEKKAREVKEKIVKDKLDKSPMTKEMMEYQEASQLDGKQWCYDSFRDKKFRASYSEIEQAVLAVSQRAIAHDWVSLNDFYDELGLPTVDMGEYFGWPSSDVYNGRLPIDIGSYLTANGVPSICIDYMPNKVV